MRLISLPAEHVAAVWPLVDEHFRRACARSVGDISPDTLRDECVRGEARLLAILDDGRLPAAAVARFCIQADRSVACELVACGGGSLAAWRHVVPEFEAWARFLGATSVRLTGRPGWERIFRGYRRRPLVSLVKDL